MTTDHIHLHIDKHNEIKVCSRRPPAANKKTDTVQKSWQGPANIQPELTEHTQSTFIPRDRFTDLLRLAWELRCGSSYVKKHEDWLRITNNVPAVVPRKTRWAGITGMEASVGALSLLAFRRNHELELIQLRELGRRYVYILAARRRTERGTVSGYHDDTRLQRCARRVGPQRQ